MAWVFRIFDALHGPWLFEIIWHVLTRISTLNEEEINAAVSVLGTGVLSYGIVRVAEGRILGLIFRCNKGRAFVTFRIINFPKSGKSNRSRLDVLVHELVHVCQFELVGSIYIWQAIRAQQTTGYKYGGWRKLKEDWRKGKHFCDYNREQQGMIAQDYYRKIVAKGLPIEDPISQAYEPFIEELRNGDL